MGQTLRRSCAACARSKLGCDLRMPRCSRCEKRGVGCVYVNEPLTAEWPRCDGGEKIDGGVGVRRGGGGGGGGELTQYRPGRRDLDPFDSYPRTRLPRERVQRLIFTFLNKIAFQYYPLDMSSASNPFLVSWWPLALGDPALFHVSLQTACLDEELLAQKGFVGSELLMADSVALVRRKVGDGELALQDGTMNSVITLAAIEFGKGNIEVSKMHVDGVKRLVDLRGGINAVRQTSPLTARMVSWVSLLIMRSPQFPVQDYPDSPGIPPIPEWHLRPPAPPEEEAPWSFGPENCDPAMKDVFLRLRSVFARARCTPLPPTRLHDLACFVVHRLLSVSEASPVEAASSSTVGECIRYALVAYMFIIQGPTYYSHAVILDDVVAHFAAHFSQRLATLRMHGSLDVWLLSVGMVASAGTERHAWFVRRARRAAVEMMIGSWEQVFERVGEVLWYAVPHGESVFRMHWDEVLGRRGWVEGGGKMELGPG